MSWKEAIKKEESEQRHRQRGPAVSPEWSDREEAADMYAWKTLSDNQKQVYLILEHLDYGRAYRGGDGDKAVFDAVSSIQDERLLEMIIRLYDGDFVPNPRLEREKEGLY